MTEMPKSIKFPFKSDLPEIRSDALVDFHIRISQLMNYIGQLLILIDLSAGIEVPKGDFLPKLPTSALDKTPTTPSLAFNREQWAKISKYII